MSDEIFDVVDERDHVVGQRPRAEVHRLGLKHRATHVLVFNACGQVFLQKRSARKDCFPGRWDSSASGHLDVGETYDACAVRETREELGLALAQPPRPLFKIDACPQTGQEHLRVYHCRAEGPFRLHPEEIETGDWFTPERVTRWIAERPDDFAPSLPLIWHRAQRFAGRTQFRPDFQPRPQLSHVLFDFDGTLSLIREGWPDVMVPMFVEFLPARDGETEAARRQLMFDDIMRLNGKQTIYQMIQFAERVRERGGQPREPLWYKKEYLRRLDERIAHRVEGLRSARLRSEALLVFGARNLLESLARRGLTLYLASGTDEAYVRQEAELLDVARFFGPHIYGALDQYRQFSKKQVIERILRENRIDGSRLLALGDGYVEIQNTKEAGGLAIAVATDEAHNGSGQFDPWKLQRLWGVDADIAIADFRDADPLLDWVLGLGPEPVPPAATT